MLLVVSNKYVREYKLSENKCFIVLKEGESKNTCFTVKSSFLTKAVSVILHLK